MLQEYRDPDFARFLRRRARIWDPCEPLIIRDPLTPWIIRDERYGFVSQDATSLKFVPNGSSEFTTLLSGSGIANPTVLYLHQEASGNLAETISGTITLTAGGSPQYQQAVTGWARKAIVCRNGQTDWFLSTSSSLPNCTLDSVLWFAWVSHPANNSGGGPSSLVTFAAGFGTGLFSLWSQTSGCKLRPTVGNQIANGTASYASTTGYLLQELDHTDNPNMHLVTALETVTAHSIGVNSTKQLYIGGDNGADTDPAGGMGIMYLAAWFGTNAQLNSTGRTTLINLFNSGPPASGAFSRGRGSSIGGIGTRNGSRGGLVNREASRIARLALQSPNRRFFDQGRI